MYIKVKVSDGGRADGGHGLMGAMHWAMTAAAGATATAADFAGQYENEIEDFIVVSNTEAGGWSAYNSVSSSTTTHSYNAGWQAESPKTGRDFKKRFEIGSNTSQSTYTNRWGPKFGMWDDDKDEYLIGLNKLSYFTSTSSTTNGYSWFRNLGPKDAHGYWNISVTSKYVYFWPDSISNASSGEHWFCGVADLFGTPQYLLNAVSDNCASVGIYTSSSNDSGNMGTSTTTYAYDFLHHYFAGINGNVSETFVGTQTVISQGNISNLSYNSSIFPLGLSHWYGAAQDIIESGRPIFDEYGSSIGALTPVIIMQPWKSLPIQYVEGLYYYYPQSAYGNTTYWATKIVDQFNDRYVYADNGDKYVIKASHDSMQLKAVRAM